MRGNCSMLKGVNVTIPSYKRVGAVKGYDNFRTAKIVIPESQRDDYARHYDPRRLIVIPDDPNYTQEAGFCRKEPSAFINGLGNWEAARSLTLMRRMKLEMWLSSRFGLGTGERSPTGLPII